MNHESSGIEIHQLTKTYGPLVAVNQLDLSIPRGKMFGLLGPNGAGKTTTISMLSTILSPTSGSATLHGFDLVKERGEIRKIIGVCPQDTVFYELLTVRENIYHIADMYGLQPRDYKERADELLGRIQLLEKRNAKCKTLSGGMKRRLNVLMAVIHDPEIVFLDEPSAGLDPQTKNVVWEFIRDFGKQNKTVILTTHNMEEADDLADKLAIMDHGKVIAQGTPQELKATIGTGDVIEFRLGESDLAQQENIVALLQEEPATQWVKPLGRQLISFGALDGLRNLSNYYEMLESSLHVTMKDIAIRQNSLEDVFLNLTGKGLRE